MKSRSIAYSVTTGVLAFVLLSGGLAELFRVQGTVDGVVHLGYPVYLVTILGVWKVLGAIAIVIPGTPRLKEWAYAGAFFDFTGAIASYIACGDGVVHMIGPAVFAICVLVSWAFRPQSRMLGSVLT
jgi:uncharacterized membrane protein YphA (DoxX/SURF4 family)